MNPTKLEDLKPGDIIIADAGFTCLEPGEHKVWEKHGGKLVVGCRDGDHYLDGQRDAAGNLVGISKRPV